MVSLFRCRRLGRLSHRLRGRNELEISRHPSYFGPTEVISSTHQELFRYETGIIIPPLAAGTIQILDRDCTIAGGEFMANSEGIAHYRKFGYKGRSTASPLQFSNTLANESKFFAGHLAGEGVLETELAQGCGWTTVRFKRGRGILHCGLWV